MNDRPVTLSTYPFELLRFRRFGPVTPAAQMGILAALYVATTLLFARQVGRTGKMADTIRTSGSCSCPSPRKSSSAA